jgi:putative endonuclease
MPSDTSISEESRAVRSSAWFLYLIECIDGSIYTGIAVDVAARYAAHACGKGARYTRAHPPARLLASCEYPDRSSALKAELRIKKLKPEAKRRLAAELSAADQPASAV